MMRSSAAPSAAMQSDLGAQHGSHGEQAAIVPLGLAFIMLTYACFLPVVRDLGAGGLAVPAAATAVLSIIYSRKYLQFTLIALAVVGAVFIALSWAGYLHRGITLLFDRGAIFQQSFYTIFLVFLVPAFAFVHEQIERGAPGWRGLELLVLVMAVASKLVLLALGLQVGEETRLGVSQLINADMLLMFIAVRRYVLDLDKSLVTRIIVALVLLATAGSFQSVLALGCLLLIMMLPQFAKGIAAAVVIGLFVVAIGAQPFVTQIWWWDYNTGVRLLFWQDAFERFVASGAMGVGFGTETIRPVYQVGIEEHVISGLDREGYINVAAHNAYVDAFYRMGLAGGGIVLFYMLQMFGRALAPLRTASPLDCWVVCALAISLMVNVALASVGFVFGTAYLLGWLVCRLRAEQPDPT